MGWIIFLLIYVVGAAVTATIIFYQNGDRVTFKDLWFTFLMGAFWFITIFIMAAVWWEDHKDDEAFKWSDLFTKKDAENKNEEGLGNIKN